MAVTATHHTEHAVFRRNLMANLALHTRWGARRIPFDDGGPFEAGDRV